MMANRDSPESDGAIKTPVTRNTPGQTSRRFENWLDIASTILLSVAALASSWAGYQSTRWSGVQSANYNIASARWVESARIATFAGLYQSIDLELFMQWLDAYMAGDEERAKFYRQRFRPEFRPAFEAWMATQPRNNPAAPSSPFILPDYRLERYERATRLESEAGAASDRAQAANQQGDDYVLTTVIFSTILFFTGIAPHLGSFRTRAVVLSIAAGMGLAGLVQLATYPVK
jgi:hypothetical protein